MNILRASIPCLLLLASSLFAAAEQLTCDICGQPIRGQFYYIEDRVEAKKKKVCEDCEKIEARCFICDLPVKDGFKQLPDGRYLCARELRGVIESDAEAKEICRGVKDDLDRLLSRFLTMPGDNVQLSIVDRFHLENLFKAPGMENSCVSVYGATASNPLPGGKFLHTIDLLSYLQKPRLMAVCAHEYTHAWMGENVTHLRQITLDRDTVEAFCELVAYKYMDSRHEESEMENIRRNHYTKGQILVLVAADEKFGFNTVMEWMKNGEDTKVDMENLDRIRVVKDGVTPRASVASSVLFAPPAPPTPVPDTLTLKGISGSGQRRFALINNATFEVMEKGRVRVGQTNVTVQCLEIQNDSVIIQVGGSTKKEQLFLRAAR